MIARKGMADLLGIDEKSLSRAIQKKKMLASMGVDEELFKLSGDALTSAADKMLKGNEISQDQFDEIIAFSDDQRTTDELIEEQNEIAEDNRLANILQLDQASLQAKAAFEAAEGNRVLQGQLMNEIQRGNEAYVASIGRAVQMRDIGQGLTKEALKAQVLDAKASDPNAKVNNTGDLLYIPNQSLTTSGYGEMFELDRRDAVMAGPSNYIEAATQGTSKGANVALLATAIVDALKGATFTVDPGALATFFNNAT
jgi:hypothetical protein